MFTKKSLFAVAIVSLVAQSSNAMTVKAVAERIGVPAAKVVSALGRTSARGRVSADQALFAEREILGSNLVTVAPVATPWTTRAASAVRNTAWDANMAVGRGVLKAFDGAAAASEAAAPAVRQAKIAGQKYGPARVVVKAQRAARRDPETAGYVAASVAGIMAASGLAGAVYFNHQSAERAAALEAAKVEDAKALNKVASAVGLRTPAVKAIEDVKVTKEVKASEGNIISKNFSAEQANSRLWNLVTFNWF